MKLNIYLLQESVTNEKVAIQNSKFDLDVPYRQLERIDIDRQSSNINAWAFLQQESPRTPEWVSPISSFFSIDKVVNISNSLVIIIKTAGRFFAITYGYGYTALNKTLIEPDFGLKVVLNSVDPKRLRSIVSRNLDTSTLQTMVVSNTDSLVHEFKFQADSDLVKKISGFPLDSELLGSKISGSDSIVINDSLDLDTLKSKCELLYDLYQKDVYKESFPFFDQIRLVRKYELIEELDRILESTFEEDNYTSILFSNPRIEEFDKIDQYKLRCNKKWSKPISLEPKCLFDELIKTSSSTYKLNEIQIRPIDAGSKPIGKLEPLKDYMVFDTLLNGKKYLLLEGKWFEIDIDFYEKIDNKIDGLEDITLNLKLPDWEQSKDEGQYNVEASKTREYLLLDKKNFPILGYSRIEVADLVTPDLEFICVKKYESSQKLSHLFSQGVVSAKLHSGEPKYRDFILKKKEESGLSIKYDVNVESNQIKYVYAIGFTKEGELKELLPFFSKVTLSQAVEYAFQMSVID